LPFWMASRACSRRRGSSGMVGLPRLAATGKVVPDAMGQDAQERLRGGPMEGNPSLPRGTLYFASPNRHRPSSVGTGIPSTRWPHHSTTLHGMHASRPLVGHGRFAWGRPRSSSQVGGCSRHFLRYRHCHGGTQWNTPMLTSRNEHRVRRSCTTPCYTKECAGGSQRGVVASTGYHRRWHNRSALKFIGLRPLKPTDTDHVKSSPLETPGCR
jgi:hypothetical protein